MSQQLGRGAQLARGRRGRGGGRGGRGRGPSSGPRAFKSKISEIETETFNVGSTRFVAQFEKSRESTAYYVQRKIGGEEGYLAALEIRTGTQSTVDLPAALAADATQDEIIIRNVEVQGVGKLRSKLKGARKSAFSILYDQCSQEVKDKLRSGQGWDDVEREQTTHELITRIRRIVTGFEEHKQGTYNLVQSMRRLFLHIQGENESVADYVRHFKGLWNTAEAFGASPGCTWAI